MYSVATNLEAGMPVQIDLSAHARAVMVEREIALDWIERTVTEPDGVEPDPKDPACVRAFSAIPERDGRVLRVVYVATSEGVRIVTVFFDRGRRRRT